MKLIDRNKLRREMFINQYTFVKLADKIGCSRSNIYNKVNGDRDFSEKEIVQLIKLFSTAIFFDNVSLQNVDN